MPSVYTYSIARSYTRRAQGYELAIQALLTPGPPWTSTRLDVLNCDLTRHCAHGVVHAVFVMRPRETQLLGAVSVSQRT